MEHKGPLEESIRRLQRSGQGVKPWSHSEHKGELGPMRQLAQ